MIRRILAALDGSARAVSVFDAAAEMAARFGATLRLFRAIHVPPEFPAAAAGSRSDPLPTHLAQRAQADLARIATRDSARLVMVESPIVRVGDPWRLIIDVSDESTPTSSWSAATAITRSTASWAPRPHGSPTSHTGACSWCTSASTGYWPWMQTRRTGRGHREAGGSAAAARVDVAAATAALPIPATLGATDLARLAVLGAADAGALSIPGPAGSRRSESDDERDWSDSSSDPLHASHLRRLPSKSCADAACTWPRSVERADWLGAVARPSEPARWPTADRSGHCPSVRANIAAIARATRAEPIPRAYASVAPGAIDRLS